LKLWPSEVQNWMSWACATAMGSTVDCADHSYSVYFFESAIICSPVAAGTAGFVVTSEPRLRKLSFWSEKCSSRQNLLDRAVGLVDRDIRIGGGA
jgi:hypothetical protein